MGRTKPLRARRGRRNVQKIVDVDELGNENVGGSRAMKTRERGRTSVFDRSRYCTGVSVSCGRSVLFELL